MHESFQILGFGDKQQQSNKIETLLKNADKLVKQVGKEILGGEIIVGINYLQTILCQLAHTFPLKQDSQHSVLAKYDNVVAFGRSV